MNAAFVDFETTGLTLPSVSDLAKQPKIIEIGIVVVKDGVIVDEYEQLVNPGELVTAEITKITGITNEMLEGKPSFKQVVDQVALRLAGCDAFIAHNAPFDRACLEYELMRLEEEAFPWPAQTICSAQEFTHEFGFRPKLIQLYEAKMGKPLEQTHRALDDIKALVAIFEKEGML